MGIRIKKAIAGAASILPGRTAFGFLDQLPREDIAQILQADMENNDVALLASASRAGGDGHATLVLKWDGKLYHLNNQGWETFEELNAWFDRWQAYIGQNKQAGYKAIILETLTESQRHDWLQNIEKK